MGDPMALSISSRGRIRLDILFVFVGCGVNWIEWLRVM